MPFTTIALDIAPPSSAPQHRARLEAAHSASLKANVVIIAHALDIRAQESGVFWDHKGGVRFGSRWASATLWAWTLARYLCSPWTPTTQEREGPATRFLRGRLRRCDIRGSLRQRQTFG
jgi:hypothetical protein